MFFVPLNYRVLSYNVATELASWFSEAESQNS